MFDRCFCINSMVYSPKSTKGMTLYFVGVSLPCSWAKPYIRGINGTTNIKYKGPEPVYLTYQIRKLIARELSC